MNNLGWASIWDKLHLPNSLAVCSTDLLIGMGSLGCAQFYISLCLQRQCMPTKLAPWSVRWGSNLQNVPKAPHLPLLHSLVDSKLQIRATANSKTHWSFCLLKTTLTLTLEKFDPTSDMVLQKPLCGEYSWAQDTHTDKMVNTKTRRTDPYASACLRREGGRVRTRSAQKDTIGRTLYCVFPGVLDQGAWGRDNIDIPWTMSSKLISLNGDALFCRTAMEWGMIACNCSPLFCKGTSNLQLYSLECSQNMFSCMWCDLAKLMDIPL